MTCIDPSLLAGLFAALANGERKHGRPINTFLRAALLVAAGRAGVCCPAHFCPQKI